ncbi:hypothetical protein EJP77_08745 [Paenibacillus zeisoli]|uniref:Alpha/beta hydrolase n=1 Tax=Paenibacillus zeisoli TaxID=2496267 RepID=A0A433XI19_9BACL|nr:hypothetical protein [Paenibacillus zeisoli]RUT33711.1 hypothetical protein EJP77_08745 [Paenibacillus zeisoli]
MSSIPNFTSTGELPKGIHLCSADEFINFFSFSEYRNGFKKTISDIFDYALSRNARYLFVGGSFVTNKSDPGDIDCIIVFNRDKDVPSRTEELIVEQTKLDIMYISLEHEDEVVSYVELFLNNRFGRKVGMIQIDLYSEGKEWTTKQEVNDNTFEIIKRAYTDRRIHEVNDHQGVLVTIHGLLSQGKWNAEIAPIASSQGWIFAPYIYEYNTPDLLINPKKRQKILDDFREWIYDLHMRYPKYRISIIAHSYGSHIIASYLEGFEEFTPVFFNCIILTGSIINTNFNWNLHRATKVARVLNEIAPNDQWVSFMPNEWRGIYKKNEIFGKSGVDGFSNNSDILIQSTNNIFTHTNMIKRDVIEAKWMPFLRANRYAYQSEMALYIYNNAKNSGVLDKLHGCN